MLEYPSHTVLIVDDLEVNILLSKTLFRLVRPEANVISARSGESGLKIFKEYNPDLIITDIRMPGGMNGFELIEQVRLSEGGSRPYIVALSASLRSDEVSFDEYDRSKADLILEKPLDKQTVHNILKDIDNLSKKDRFKPEIVYYSDKNDLDTHFNFKEFSKRLGGEKTILEEVFNTAIKSLNEDVEKIRSAIESDELDFNPNTTKTIKECLHRLSGMSCIVGFTKLFDISKHISSTFHQQKSLNLPEMIETLYQEQRILNSLSLDKVHKKTNKVRIQV
ncbi:MAG: hypothetical protein Kapaf2KO_07060 [Candidatus Kapaibacteriales bacterium]